MQVCSVLSESVCQFYFHLLSLTTQKATASAIPLSLFSNHWPESICINRGTLNCMLTPYCADDKFKTRVLITSFTLGSRSSAVLLKEVLLQRMSSYTCFSKQQSLLLNFISIIKKTERRKHKKRKYSIQIVISRLRLILLCSTSSSYSTVLIFSFLNLTINGVSSLNLFFNCILPCF